MKKVGIGLVAIVILLMVTTALTKPKTSSVTQPTQSARVEMARSETNEAQNNNNQNDGPIVVRVKGFSVKMMPSSSNQPAMVSADSIRK